MKRMKQDSLLSFLKKQRPDESVMTASATTHEEQVLLSTNHQNTALPISADSTSNTAITIDAPPIDSTATTTRNETDVNPNDVGYYIDKIGDISVEQKYHIIKHPWQPPLGYQFPFSLHTKQNKTEKRFLSQLHLNKYKWAVYSEQCKGLFCKYCLVFVDLSTSNRTLLHQSLVRKPLVKFSKLTGKDGALSKHETTKYHKNCVTSAENFCKVYGNPQNSILNTLNTEMGKQIEENRKRLRPIIETIIFMGRQNIPLRGKRDDGRINLHINTNTTANRIDGNFRQLLKYRAEGGDQNLKEQLLTYKSNASYISKTTQNQLINICGDHIKKEICKRILKAKYYSIIFDETTDISTSSQLSLVITYVHENKRYEDFIDFLNIHDEVFANEVGDDYEPKISGKMIGQLVVEKIKSYGLNIYNCIGVGTDGCSVMVSEQKGAVSEILQVAVNAFRCPCFNQALNLSLS